MEQENNERTFGERMRKVRMDAQMTQHELGEKINVTAQAVSQYEQDKRNPGFALACSIADALGCDIRYLMGVEYNQTREGMLAEETAGLSDEAFRELMSYVGYLKLKEKNKVRKNK